jgi:hypothetical protein
VLVGLFVVLVGLFIVIVGLFIVLVGHCPISLLCKQKRPTKRAAKEQKRPTITYKETTYYEQRDLPRSKRDPR